MSYVRRDGELTAPPPYALEMNDLLAFVVPADRKKLRALCDRELNLGPLRYTPLGDFVIMYGARIGNLSQGTVCRTREMGVWIPVEREGAWLTYSPYVWVESATSTHVGREIFGYSKLTGAISLPEPGVPAKLSAAADTLALRQGENLVERATVVEIEGSVPWQPPAAHGLRKWLDLLQLAFELGEEVLELRPTFDELVSLLGGMRSVFLKQTPAAHGAGAVYQGLVEARVQPDLQDFAGDVLEGTWRVRIPSYQEPRIAETLGLRGQTTSRGFEAEALGQAWLRFRGELHPGTEVWRANGL